jgi:hypothetical protein
MKEFIISEQLAQATLNYLAEQPYKEVMVLIADLMKLKPVEESKKEGEPK